MAETKLDTTTTKPATTAPGDAPADTTDATQIAQSAPVAPGKEAQAVGTVNAVVPVPAAKPSAAKKPKERTEKYTSVRPDGTEVKITRNIETGATSVDDES